MKEFFSTYKITLETRGPLYIGSGRELGKKEFIYNRKSQKILIPDLTKMYHSLQEKNLARAYENYLLDQREKDLYTWLNRKGITYDIYKNWTGYILDCSDAVLDKNTKNLSLFMKDAYGKPYVPGSSLKGALRTILFCDELRNDQLKCKKIQDEIRKGMKYSRQGRNFLQKESSNIEVEVFHTCDIDTKYVPKRHALQDHMKGVIISDSYPIDSKNLVLCQKIDVDVHGKEKVMPILRECIKPGTKIEFEMTIDENVIQYYDIGILEAVNRFLKCYQSYLKHFGKVEEEQDILYLGGSVGFVSKTILYSLFSEKEAVQITSDIFDKTLSDRIKREHHHERDIRLGVSPHIKKCTRYAGKQYEFGRCKIYIE